MMAAATLAALALVVLAVACDGGAAKSDGTGGNGGGVGSGGGTGNGGNGGAAGGAGAGGAGGGLCANAVANQPCSTPGLICGGEACTSACDFCNLLRCQDGTWQPEESFPAPCFACGTDAHCQRNVQYCFILRGGPEGNPTSYTCKPLPASCQPAPVCACLASEPLAGPCTEGTMSGELTVTFDAP